MQAPARAVTRYLSAQHPNLTSLSPSLVRPSLRTDNPYNSRPLWRPAGTTTLLNFPGRENHINTRLNTVSLVWRPRQITTETSTVGKVAARRRKSGKCHDGKASRRWRERPSQGMTSTHRGNKGLHFVYLPVRPLRRKCDEDLLSTIEQLISFSPQEPSLAPRLRSSVPL